MVPKEPEGMLIPDVGRLKYIYSPTALTLRMLVHTSQITPFVLFISAFAARTAGESSRTILLHSLRVRGGGGEPTA